MMIEADQPRRIAAVVCWWQDLGELVIDLDVVAPRDAGELFTHLRPKVPESEAELIDFIHGPSVVEVAPIRTAPFNELPKSGTHTLERRLQRPFGTSRRNSSGEIGSALQSRLHAVSLVLDMTIPEKHPPILKEYDHLAREALVARRSFPVDADTQDAEATTAHSDAHLPPLTDRSLYRSLATVRLG